MVVLYKLTYPFLPEIPLTFMLENNQQDYPVVGMVEAMEKQEAKVVEGPLILELEEPRLTIE
jgi:hypothetical protein